MRRVVVLCIVLLALVLAGCGGGYHNLPDSTKQNYDEARIEASSGNYTEALATYQEMAEQGHPQGLYEMGMAYAYGRGVQPDPALAAQYFQQASEISSSRRDQAEFELGKLYFDGQGVAQDYGNARVMFERSINSSGEFQATPSYINGLYYLGRIYEEVRARPKFIVDRAEGFPQ